MRFGAEERDWGCFFSLREWVDHGWKSEGKTYLPQEHECAWTIGKGEDRLDDENYARVRIFQLRVRRRLLRVYDEGEEEILATYSGDIFPHSIVFENQSSLTLKWTSLKLNSDKGFKVHYYTDRMDEVKCLNDCDRVGNGKERLRVSERKSRGGLFHRRASTRAGNEGKRDEQVPRIFVVEK